MIKSVGLERTETSMKDQPVGFLANQLESFVKQFDLEDKDEINKANALFGYTSFDAVTGFESLSFIEKPGEEIPQLSYSLYRFIIEVNHFNNTLTIVELTQNNEASRIKEIEDLLRNHNIPRFSFCLKDEDEKTNMSDQDYLDMVEKGIKHCRRCDVFQIVISRSFSKAYQGDDFNLYGALRSVNPSPYLFYFDCGSFRIMGSL